MLDSVPFLKRCMLCARRPGLDARAAAIVMRVVRNIVDTGRTITCTVHQPSIDIFEVREPSTSLACPGLYVPEAALSCPHLLLFSAGLFPAWEYLPA
jgi:hypothetical protein